MDVCAGAVTLIAWRRTVENKSQVSRADLLIRRSSLPSHHHFPPFPSFHVPTSRRKDWQGLAQTSVHNSEISSRPHVPFRCLRRPECQNGCWLAELVDEKVVRCYTAAPAINPYRTHTESAFCARILIPKCYLVQRNWNNETSSWAVSGPSQLTPTNPQRSPKSKFQAQDVLWRGQGPTSTLPSAPLTFRGFCLQSNHRGLCDRDAILLLFGRRTQSQVELVSAYTHLVSLHNHQHRIGSLPVKDGLTLYVTCVDCCYVTPGAGTCLNFDASLVDGLIDAHSFLYGAVSNLIR